MNKYHTTLKIQDKFYLEDQEVQEFLLNTLVFANSEQQAINQLKSRYVVLEIISITLKD